MKGSKQSRSDLHGKKIEAIINVLQQVLEENTFDSFAEATSIRKLLKQLN